MARHDAVRASKTSQAVLKALWGNSEDSRTGKRITAQRQSIGRRCRDHNPQKKSPIDLGGRGRAHGQEERQMIGQLIEEATHSGARLETAVDAVGLSIRTFQRWNLQDDGADRRRGPDSDPANKLAPAERQNIIEIANSPAFRDISPKQIVPQLADQGIYVASESSFYRVLKGEGQITHREPSRPATSRKPKEHAATGPCQVWSWD